MQTNEQILIPVLENAFFTERHCAKNVWHCAENVRHGAKKVWHGAENVLHGAKNVRLSVRLGIVCSTIRID